MKTKFIAAALALSSFAMFGSPATAQEDPFAKGSAAYQQADYVEAAKWFRLAAEQGNATAQSILGLMCTYVPSP
jgi:TPR repeat protein